MAVLFRTKRIYQRNGIEIKGNPSRSPGIFAQKQFRPGAVIEIAPLILLPSAERDYLQCTSLFRYYFLVDNKETPVALGLGYSSLYNHANMANATYNVNLKDASIILEACKTIDPGDEITLNYNGPPDDETPVYFSPEAPLLSDPGETNAAEQMVIRSEMGLYIKPVKGKGRGVFCRRLIKKNDYIETSPVLVLPAEDYDPVNATLLSNYFFNYNKDEKTLALSLGYGSLYNHSRHSNAAYYLDRDDRTMYYYALEDIPPGKEICINYSGEPGKDFTDWFASREIACSG